MPVHIEVVEVRGQCNADHEVGQSWIIGNETVEGICFSGFCSLVPWVHMMRFDAETPWPVEISCPDHENAVVFRIEVIE